MNNNASGSGAQANDNNTFKVPVRKSRVPERMIRMDFDDLYINPDDIKNSKGLENEFKNIIEQNSTLNKENKALKHESAILKHENLMMQAENQHLQELLKSKFFCINK